MLEASLPFALVAGIVTRAVTAQIDLLEMSGIEAFLTNVGLPILMAVGCYFLLRDFGKRELERYRARESTFREVMLSREQTNQQMIAQHENRMREASNRDARRDKLLQETLDPIAERLTKAADAVEALQSRIVKENNAMRGAVARLAQYVGRLGTEVAQHRDDDKQYRSEYVTPALQWVQRMPQIMTQMGRLTSRIEALEKQVSDTGNLGIGGTVPDHPPAEDKQKTEGD